MYRIKEMEHLDALMAEAENHLRACLEHIVRGQKKQIVIFLDNVDQRPQHFQDEVFLISQALAEHWPITAFVSLRPDTFKQSRISGSLSAYQPRVFTIDPPRIDQVLSKRLRFAKDLLERQGRLPWFPEGFSVRSETLLRYISMLLETFEDQRQIIEFIDNMSGGNVRRALDFVATFIGSAHVDSTKILNIIGRQGRYNLPLHEFMRAVIYRDHMHYDPRDSSIANLFDIVAHDPREHFLLPSLLAYVERAGQVGGADGYVDRATVFAFAQNNGFHPRQIAAAITRGLAATLLATPAGAHTEAAQLRITTVGAYSVRRLAGLFAYVDAIIIDTPIIEAEARRAIIDSTTIQERLSRIEVFLAYLDRCWERFDHPPVEIFDWSSVHADLDADIGRARDGLQRKGALH